MSRFKKVIMAIVVACVVTVVPTVHAETGNTNNDMDVNVKFSDTLKIDDSSIKSIMDFKGELKEKYVLGGYIHTTEDLVHVSRLKRKIGVNEDEEIILGVLEQEVLNRIEGSESTTKIDEYKDLQEYIKTEETEFEEELNGVLTGKIQELEAKKVGVEKENEKLWRIMFITLGIILGVSAVVGAFVGWNRLKERKQQGVIDSSN